MALLVFRAWLDEDGEVGFGPVVFSIGGGGFDGRLHKESIGDKELQKATHDAANGECMRRVLSHFVDQISVDQFAPLAFE
jgi:hypothetical protein